MFKSLCLKLRQHQQRVADAHAAGAALDAETQRLEAAVESARRAKADADAAKERAEQALAVALANPDVDSRPLVTGSYDPRH